MIKLIRYTIYIFLIAALLNGCGDIKKGMSGKKINKGEEFLIDKKNPLVLPPEFNELPIPKNTGQSRKISESTEEDIKKILEIKSSSEKKDSKSVGIDNTEQFILKSIK
jgi:hypothetical protein